MGENLKTAAAALACAMIVSGCWTFNETPYPLTVPTRLQDDSKAPSVKLEGFETVITSYDAVTGFQTVYVPGYCGRRHWHGGYYETMPVTSFVANRRPYDGFRRRARDIFEKNGFTIAVNESERIVEVDFDGPYQKDGDALIQLGWQLGTIFFCDYGSVLWKARLRIRDGKNGRLLFSQDYDQSFETHVFGLIPLFGISSSDATSYSRMQNWCLSALTDRAIADATEFLTK